MGEITMKYDDFLDHEQLRRYAQSMNARAKANQIAGRLDADLLQDRIFASGGKCEWCGISLVKAEFEIDHILSLHQQGENTAANLAIACPACNRSKATKSPSQFAHEIYARTGLLTPLLQRLIDFHNLDLRVQRSLFDTPDDVTATTITSDDDPDEVPPYVWGT